MLELYLTLDVYLQGNTRLEYEFVENRPLLIAILKYMHVLTNIACHRTALGLAKVLLSLDPSDPLAVIFIIDTLALRAKEYQWLLDLIEHWRDKRQANRLFHMRYSRALAMFHVACKKKDYSKLIPVLRCSWSEDRLSYKIIGSIDTRS